MAFDRETCAKALAKLAEKQVYLGTSSWKYPGWLGQLYEEQRYLYRGRVAKTRFEKHCLGEYAEVFKTVCVDAGYYQFPQPKTIESMAAQVPDDFRFSFKVTEEITTKQFTRLPRYGSRAGQLNENFLNANLFQSAFLGPLSAIREKVGVLIFEFSHFYKKDFERGREFIAALDTFLEQLPKNWQYGIEIRNESFLHADYFATLAKHGVAHIYNQWQRMPPVSAQLQLEGSFTTDFTGARFLLTPGRKYQEAVDTFSPYNEVQMVDADARQAASDLAQRAIARAGKKPSVLYVNNRLEGNSLGTIIAVLANLGLLPPKTANQNSSI